VRVPRPAATMMAETMMKSGGCSLNKANPSGGSFAARPNDRQKTKA